nr:gastrula zinc finger protein XlCGF7.1-like [Aedes albopictus]
MPHLQQIFSSKSAVNAHQKYHAEEKTFVCATCGAAFYQKYLLKLHEQNHVEGPLPFKCEMCEKSYKSKNGLVNHIRVHTGEKPFSCRHCSMTFATSDARRSHEMNHSATKPFKCSYCDKSYRNRRQREEHENMHTGIKPFKCSSCDKAFTRKQSQIDHEKAHSGIKPYQCNLCNCSYTHKVNLRRHLESLHPPAEDSLDVPGVSSVSVP